MPKKRYIIIALVILFAIAASVWYIREFAILPPPAYYLLSDIPDPKPSDKVLVISPHPDDETLGAAGFMKRSKDVGAEVEVVIVTDGNKHGLKNVRHQETLNAMRVLDIPENHVIFLDYPDGNLKKYAEDFHQRLQQIIEQFRPTILLSTHAQDIHPDHKVVGQTVDQILGSLPEQPTVYQFLIHYHRYPRPQGFHPNAFLLPPVKLLSTTTPWQRFALTVEEQNAKNEAVLQYKSQLSRKNLFLRALLLSFIRQNEIFTVVHP